MQHSIELISGGGGITASAGGDRIITPEKIKEIAFKFLLESVYGKNESNSGFFKKSQNTGLLGQPGQPDQPDQPGQPDQPVQPDQPDQPEQECSGCKEMWNFLHDRRWCAICYVKKFCNVIPFDSDDGEQYFIIQQRNPSKVLFTSSPIIERSQSLFLQKK